VGDVCEGGEGRGREGRVCVREGRAVRCASAGAGREIIEKLNICHLGKFGKYFCIKMMFLEICVGCVFDVCVSIVMGDFIHNRTRLYNAWKGMIKYVCILVLICE
jgi:hypothetical protein